MPPDQGAEVAFAGRSNAGKSTAINALANRRKLAFVSKTPGRTQAINFFDMGNHCSLVDLPGYGYAKVPRQEQARWDELIGTYISNRNSLILLIIIVDIRRGLTPLDWQMLDWLAPTNKAVHVLLTKADKLNRQQADAMLKQTSAELARHPGEATAQIFSGTSKTGVKQAQAVIARWLKQ
ncbi:MAG: ribosome biogenesis GTP-binding protein YihA/YsxC [Burkholderiales bacterium]|nr:ribosome biogenesis GTP-binding protein YihA/YsxC [Burkholderiales bacterium]